MAQSPLIDIAFMIEALINGGTSLSRCMDSGQQTAGVIWSDFHVCGSSFLVPTHAAES